MLVLGQGLIMVAQGALIYVMLLTSAQVPGDYRQTATQPSTERFSFVWVYVRMVYV